MEKHLGSEPERPGASNVLVSGVEVVKEDRLKVRFLFGEVGIFDIPEKFIPAPKVLPDVAVVVKVGCSWIGGCGEKKDLPESKDGMVMFEMDGRMLVCSEHFATPSDWNGTALTGSENLISKLRCHHNSFHEARKRKKKFPFEYLLKVKTS